MRHFIPLVALLAAVSAPADERPTSVRAKRQVARGLMDDLGSADYKLRAEAERRLLELGGDVTDVVKEGLTSSNAEVAARCERILPKLPLAGLQAPDNPVFQRYLKVAGDTPDSRKLYAHFLASPDRVAEMARISADPKAATDVYQEVLDATVQDLGGFDGTRPKQPVTDRDGRLQYLLFLGSDPLTAKVGPQTKPEHASFALHFLVQQAVGLNPAIRIAQQWGPREHPELRGLLGGWAKQHADLLTGRAVIPVAVQYDLPELLAVVREGGPGADATAREKATWLDYLARHGTADDLPRITAFFKDDWELHRRGPLGKFLKPITSEVGDAARAAAVQLLGLSPTDAGFSNWNAAPSLWERDITTRCGFEAEGERMTAAEVVDDLLARNLKPPPRRRPLSIWTDSTAGPKVPLYPESDAERGGFELAVRDLVDERYTYDDAGRVYAAATLAAARVTTPAARVAARKYAGLCLDASRDATDRAAVRLKLAALVLDGGDEPAPARRTPAHLRGRAAGPLLDCYAELLAFDLPAKKPDVPSVEQLGKKPTAKERADFAVANAARREGEYVGDLIDAREKVLAQLRDLFGGDEKGPDELQKLAKEKLKAVQVDELMKAIR